MSRGHYFNEVYLVFYQNQSINSNNTAEAESEYCIYLNTSGLAHKDDPLLVCGG